MRKIELEKENRQLKAALKDMLSWATSGARYQDANPYMLPVVKRNMKLLASIDGINDYLDLPLDTEYYTKNGNS